MQALFSWSKFWNERVLGRPPRHWQPPVFSELSSLCCSLPAPAPAGGLWGEGGTLQDRSSALGWAGVRRPPPRWLGGLRPSLHGVSVVFAWGDEGAQSDRPGQDRAGRLGSHLPRSPPCFSAKVPGRRRTLPSQPLDDGNESPPPPKKTNSHSFLSPKSGNDAAPGVGTVSGPGVPGWRTAGPVGRAGARPEAWGPQRVPCSALSDVTAGPLQRGGVSSSRLPGLHAPCAPCAPPSGPPTCIHALLSPVSCTLPSGLIAGSQLRHDCPRPPQGFSVSFSPSPPSSLLLPGMRM